MKANPEYRTSCDSHYLRRMVRYRAAWSWTLQQNYRSATVPVWYVVATVWAAECRSTVLYCRRRRDPRCPYSTRTNCTIYRHRHQRAARALYFDRCCVLHRRGKKQRYSRRRPRDRISKPMILTRSIHAIFIHSSLPLMTSVAAVHTVMPRAK